MCNKAILENGGTLESVPDCYKNQEMCNKAVDNYPYTSKFVPNCYKTQKRVIMLSILILLQYNLFLNVIRLKKCVIKQFIDVYFFVFDSIPDQYKTQEICDIVISLYPFLIVYCPDKNKTQKMCDEAVDDCLAALKLILDWFFTSKMLENLDNALHANDDILFYNEDFDKVTFIAYQKHILAADLDKINLDNNFNEYDPDTIIHIRLLAWCSKFKKCKALKKKINEELMPIVWHPKRSCNLCMSEDEKKEIESVLTE